LVGSGSGEELEKKEQQELEVKSSADLKEHGLICVDSSVWPFFVKSFEHMFPGEDMRTVAKIVECLYGASSRFTQLSGSSGVSDLNWVSEYKSSLGTLEKLEGVRDSKFDDEDFGFEERFNLNLEIDASYVNFGSDFSSYSYEEEVLSSSFLGYAFEVEDFQFAIDEQDEVICEKAIAEELRDWSKLNVEETVGKLKLQARQAGEWREYEKIFERFEELVRGARQSLRTDIDGGFGNLDLELGKMLLADEIDFRIVKAFVDDHDSED
uniref:hypothetical protein n=1 Tax=Candidatus Mycoplasma haematohominis TaxID=1494318 RepID=UPI001C0A6E81